MITAMLKQIKAALPDDRPVLLMADRGIGNSPALCRAVEVLGWHYLFRIPNTVKIITARGALFPCQEIKKGGRWAASGIVFITKGQILAHIRAIWEKDCTEPWILVTNDASLTGRAYSKRNWQEQGFRDLKSGGWQLQQCRLRSEAKLARFLAVLALAQAVALALGGLAVLAGKARRLIRKKNGAFRRPLSLFKEGIRYMNRYILYREDIQQFLEPFIHKR
ncbi:MAG: transposase [Chloroflexi bacterium]|nr:transposase [Chloroflexota bacterium]